MARLKALDAYVAYLAARHEEDQENLAALLAVSIFPLWTILRFRELDASTVTWLHAVVPLVEKTYLQSQRVTAVFTQNVRFASLPTENPLPIGVPEVENPGILSAGAFDMPELDLPPDAELLPVFDEFPIEHVAESLTTEANYKTKKQMPGPEADLMQKASVRAAGEAIRLAIDGSRGVSENIVKRDRRVLGYARVTDSDPCEFCALLASQGAVYTRGSFKASNKKFTPNPNGAKNLPEGFTDIARVHNNCRCTLRPVFTKSSAMDEAARYWRDGWDRIYEKDPYRSNGEMIAEFRKWHRENPFRGSQLDLYELDRDLRDRRDALLDAGFSEDSPQVKWAERSRQNLAA